MERVICGVEFESLSARAVETNEPAIRNRTSREEINLFARMITWKILIAFQINLAETQKSPHVESPKLLSCEGLEGKAAARPRFWNGLGCVPKREGCLESQA